jgi:endonuclease/exonuclease/phosphatase family metal-dependent hydrolase
MIRSRQSHSTPRVLLLLLAGATLTTTACDDEGTTVVAGGSADVTVMTRNLYLGGDIFRLTAATGAAEIPVIAAEIFATVQANDFPARAGALAAEIEAADPDLVGLQEVTLYRIQDPSDYVTGTTTVNATDVYLDFLEVLLDSLTARGLDYTVAAEVENSDVEMPAAKSQTEFFDIRMTDRDVILARTDVETASPGAAGYQIIVPFEIVPGDTIWFERGYTWVDATVDDVDFAFVNTHLEVSLDGQLEIVQRAQALELIQQFEADTELIAVGDFNTGPGDSPYNTLMSAFDDAWTAFGSGDAGLTCCQPEHLDETRNFYERIDLVLFRGDMEVLSAEVVGNDVTDRTAGGLWPSDHAGVVATLRIQE